jgi:hypothetical protein
MAKIIVMNEALKKRLLLKMMLERAGYGVSKASKIAAPVEENT